MGITYKELVLKHTGKIKKSPIGGVFGCPGGYIPGFPDTLHNCLAKKNIKTTPICESCKKCWNTEIPSKSIANAIHVRSEDMKAEEKRKEFTKSDLKDGVMVEDELGRRWLYLGGKLRKPGICKDCNIDEICKFGYPDYERNFTINELLVYGFSKIIWERKEAKEISSEEAFEVLKQHYGCDVKIKE